MFKINSLALRTDMILHQMEAEIYQRDEYIAVKTPSRPDYFWGNYLIVNKKIRKYKDMDALIKLYSSEYKSHNEFISIAFDTTTGDIGEEKIPIDRSFTIYKNKVLTATEVEKPPKFNSEIVFKEINIDKEFENLVNLHVDDSWYLPKEQEIPFLKSKFHSLQKLHNLNKGKRFGAYLNNILVADLGIYCDGDIGRYNDVVTHRDFRRQGICGTLVYKAAQYALENMNVKTLVMEADEDYYAAAIYESTGFKHTESFKAMEWTNPDIYGKEC